MHNTCGEYVYNLWKQARTTCQYLSTVGVETKNSTTHMWVNPLLIPTVIPVTSLYLSTPKITRLHLLVYSYTHNPHPLLLTLRIKN